MQHHCQVRSSLDGKMTSAKGICTPQIHLFTYRTSFFYLHNSSLVYISLISSVAAIEFRFLWVADSCVCVVQLWGHSESIGKTATWQTSKIRDHKLPNNEVTCVRLSVLFFLPGAAPMLIWLGRRRHNVPDRLQFNIQRFLVFWDTKYKVQYIQMLCRAVLLCIHGIYLLFLA